MRLEDSAGPQGGWAWSQRHRGVGRPVARILGLWRKLHGRTAEAHNPSSLEVIPHPECLALLAANQVGRLAMIWEDEPLILPVNYTWDGSAVLFRTDPGTKLDASKGRPVVFEIDGLDPDRRRGWSVIVKGHGRAVGPHELAANLPAEPGLWPWVPGPKHYWIRIDPREISGRRIASSPRSSG